MVVVEGVTTVDKVTIEPSVEAPVAAVVECSVGCCPSSRGYCSENG